MPKKKKRTKLPKSVQVGPYKYEVVSEKADLDEGRIKHGHMDAHGFTVEWDQRIYIDPTQAEDCLADTLVHEILHAIFAAAGLSHKMKDSKEEDLIRHLSPQILDLLRRNPKLIQYLVGEDGS